MEKLLKLFLFCLFTSSLSGQIVDNTFTVEVDNVKWQISDYLVGMHSVYSFEPDAFWDDGTYLDWLTTSGVNTMRYPGGTVIKYWNWEDPTGVLDFDNWNPNYDESNDAPPEDWTSLDEYIAIINTAGIKPLLGVNITSGHKYGRKQESIDRAVRMVQYMKDQGHPGAFYYLGNEGENGGTVNEAGLFRDHAAAMKAVDPTIKCMFNWNNLTPSYLQTYLSIAGEYVDIAETHGKWPFGGSYGYGNYSVSDWQSQVPLKDRANAQRIWRNTAAELKAAAMAAGYPDIEIANNEYGLGQEQYTTGFTRFTKSMVVIDMLQEHFIGNWYMTSYWSQKRGVGEVAFPEESVVSVADDYRLNPMTFGFGMLAEAQGGNMIEMTDDSGNISVYGFTAEKDGEYLVYLLNKSDNNQNVELNFTSTSNFFTTEFESGSSLVNTADEFGELIATSATTSGPNTYSTVLPSMSYTQLKFSKEDISGIPPAGLVRIENLSLDGHLQWTNIADPTNANMHEVRLLSNSASSTSLNWEFVESSDAGWYHIEGEDGSRLQVTTDSDQVGNASGQALRANLSNASGSWTKWRLIDAGGGLYRLENQQFSNWIRATNVAQDASLPAYSVHVGGQSSTGGWTKWKIYKSPDALVIPSSYTFIVNQKTTDVNILKL